MATNDSVDRGWGTFEAVGVQEPRLLVPAPSDSRFWHLAWPKMLRTSRGTIVLAYIAARKHGRGDGSPAVSLSRDEGATFGPMHVLQEFDRSMEYEHAGNIALGEAADGAIVVLAMAHTELERSGIFGWRSEDDGVTWWPVDTSTLTSNQTGSVFGTISLLPDGRLLVIGHYRQPNPTGLWFAISNDGGRSWGEPSRITSQPWQEPALIVLKSGRWLGLAREDKAHAYHQFYSDDEGSTWHEAEAVLTAGDAIHPSPFLCEDPTQPGRIWALATVRKAPGEITLWSANANELRWERCAALLRLNGWRDYGYPWLSQLANGQWLMAFYAGEKNGPNALWGTVLELPPHHG